MKTCYCRMCGTANQVEDSESTYICSGCGKENNVPKPKTEDVTKAIYASVKDTSGIPAHNYEDDPADDKSGGYAGNQTGRYAGNQTGGYAGNRMNGYAGDQTGGYTGGQTGGYAGGQTGGYAGGQTGGYSGGQTGGYAGGQTGGYAGNQAGGYMGNQGMAPYPTDGYAAGNPPVKKKKRKTGLIVTLAVFICLLGGYVSLLLIPSVPSPLKTILPIRFRCDECKKIKFSNKWEVEGKDTYICGSCFDEEYEKVDD